jgi:hypothetical protein
MVTIMARRKVQVIACALVHLTLLAQTDTQASGYDRLGRPAWVGIAKPAPTSDAANTAIRQARNIMFNTPSGVALVSHNPGDKSTVGNSGADFFDTRNPIPTQMSDAVVVATAVSFQPFLSADGTMVYAELTATPFEVLKDKTGSLVSGKALIILQRGGTLQLSGGKVVDAVPYGGSNPIRLMNRYLLFLRYHPQEQAFTVIRLWDLSQDKPHEMNDDGHPYVSRANSVEDEFNSEADLKAYVKAH